MLHFEIEGRFLTPNDRNDRLNHYVDFSNVALSWITPNQWYCGNGLTWVFSTPLVLNKQSKHNADFSDNPNKIKPQVRIY